MTENEWTIATTSPDPSAEMQQEVSGFVLPSWKAYLSDMNKVHRNIIVRQEKEKLDLQGACVCVRGRESVCV